jgi:membrane protein implicated in regulation of membrane protease activity
LLACLLPSVGLAALAAAACLLSGWGWLVALIAYSFSGATALLAFSFVGVWLQDRAEERAERTRAPTSRQADAAIPASGRLA